MPDVTISELSSLSPTTGLALPVSNGLTTGKVSLAEVCGVISSSQITTALGYIPVDPNNMPSGSLLQSLITSNSTQQTTSTNNQYLDVMSITITPKRTNSKIQIQGAVSILMQGINGTTAGVRLLKNGASIHSNPNAVYYNCATANSMTLTANLLHEDLAGSTSAIVYKIQFFRTSTSGGWGNGVTYVNYGGSTSYMRVQEVAG